MTPLRTVFMGSDAISLPLLNSIVTDHSDTIDLVGVFTQPDRPHGRGMKLKQTPIKEWAVARGLEVLQPEQVGPEHTEWLRAAKLDLLLVMAYGHILRDDLLEAPRLPPLNFHASLLPRFRGASPIETAIATGESETGVSLMQIVRKMDAGPVLDREVVPIFPMDAREQIYEKLAAACVPLFQRNLPNLLSQTLDFKEQDASEVTYCRIITREDGAADFRKPAQAVFDRFRAFHPWPGLFFDWNDTRIKIGDTSVGDSAPDGSVPGEILGLPTAQGLPVATADHILYLNQLQRPGGRMLTAEAFHRGFPLPVGAVLQSADHLPLVAKTRKAFRRYEEKPQ